MARKNSTKPQSLRKEEFLTYWGKMKRRRKISPRPVPYKHKGSTYAEDGIRLTGTRKFVDQVLSRLTDLLGYENDSTRLQLVYRQATNKSGKPINSWTCYIQVHRRGGEAQMVNAFMSAMTGREKSVR